MTSIPIKTEATVTPLFEFNVKLGGYESADWYETFGNLQNNKIIKNTITTNTTI